MSAADAAAPPPPQAPAVTQEQLRAQRLVAREARQTTFAVELAAEYARRAAAHAHKAAAAGTTRPREVAASDGAHAARAAATAASNDDDGAAVAAPQLPRQPAANAAAFFGRWFEWQRTSAVSTSTCLIVGEWVDELAGATWSAPRFRELAIAIGGKNSSRCTSTDSVLLKLRAAADKAARVDGDAAASRVVAPRVCHVQRFAECSATDTTTLAQFAYGAFPLLPGSCSSGGRFRAAYVYVRMIAAADMPVPLRVVDAAAGVVTVADRPDAHAPLWTESADTGDDVVDATLASLGRPAALDRRAEDGAPRQAFRQLAANAIAGYRDAAGDEAARDRRLRRLLALVRMHMRRLVGNASPRVRRRFAEAQLAGSVCTQRVAADAPPTASRPRPTDDEHAERCVKAAHRLASQGLTGRAAAALVRPLPADVDMERRFRDLQALHPAGDEPSGVALPETPVFTSKAFSVADLRATVRAGMTGSAPGLDGWTFEALHDAMEHASFAADFHAIAVDICNGRVADGTRHALADSALLGIPKPGNDGTRPIALGSVVFKVAATQAIAAANATLRAKFAGTQYGCAVKGGSEYIVHNVRRFVRERIWPGGGPRRAGEERVVACVDFSNAFNTPSRQKMWEAVCPIPELVGIFATSYAKHAALHVVGCGRTIVSASGARQGTVDGPVTFALVLQAALTAANATPGAQCLAYLDDVTVIAENATAAEQALRTLLFHAAAVGLKANIAKCEVLLAGSNACVPDGSLLGAFRATTTLKLLGASIAQEDALEAVHLWEREVGKAQLLLERLRLGASPQMFEILRRCVIPKLCHAVRVHNADVSRKLTQHFDANVEELVAFWSQAHIAERQRLIMSLPHALGGMGLTRLEMVAAAAYFASCSTATRGFRKVVDQASLCAAVYREVLDRAVTADSELRRHLEVHALAGSDRVLCDVASRPHCDLFGAALRQFLMADANTVGVHDRDLDCPGCHHRFAKGGAWAQHVAGCVLASKFVTKRHNAVVALLRRWLSEAGYRPDVGEPRDLARYVCGCGGTFSAEGYAKHRDVCAWPRQQTRTSGPDVRWYPAAGRTVVGDVTVINLLVARHADESADDAFAAATMAKNERYGALCALAQNEFVTLAASANGLLGSTLKELVYHLADVLVRDRQSMMSQMSATIAYGSAAARLSCEAAIGRQPPTIEPQQVRLLRSFLRAGPVLALPRVCPGDDAGLLAAPPRVTLEDRIAAGVESAVRAGLQDFAVQVVTLVRAAEEEKRRVARAAANATRGDDADDVDDADEAEHAERPGALQPTPDEADDDAASARFRRRVAVRTAAEHAARRIVLANEQLAAATEHQRRALRVSEERLARRTAERLVSIGARVQMAEHCIRVTRDCSERLALETDATQIATDMQVRALEESGARLLNRCALVDAQLAEAERNAQTLEGQAASAIHEYDLRHDIAAVRLAELERSRQRATEAARRSTSLADARLRELSRTAAATAAALARAEAGLAGASAASRALTAEHNAAARAMTLPLAGHSPPPGNADVRNLRETSLRACGRPGSTPAATRPLQPSADASMPTPPAFLGQNPPAFPDPNPPAGCRSTAATLPHLHQLPPARSTSTNGTTLPVRNQRSLVDTHRDLSVCADSGRGDSPDPEPPADAPAHPPPVSQLRSSQRPAASMDAAPPPPVAHAHNTTNTSNTTRDVAVSADGSSCRSGHHLDGGGAGKVRRTDPAGGVGE
jgi:hypothetical protein